MFREPVEYLSDVHTVDVALVLACAIAHEVGHLLRPAGHSPEGLMHGRWGAREMRAAASGQLTFSRQEADLIRASLALGSVPVLVRR